MIETIKEKKMQAKREKRRHATMSVKKQLQEIALDVACSQLLPSTSSGVCRNADIFLPLHSSNSSVSLASDSSDFFQSQLSDASIAVETENHLESSDSVSNESAFEANYDDFYYGFTSDESSESSSLSDEDESINDVLRTWYLENNVSLTALTNLLKNLNKFHPTLPKTAETLMKTKRNFEIQSMGSGKFHHFGLENSIFNVMKSDNFVISSGTVSLNVNVDGLPLYHSSRTQFWPILCYLEEDSSKMPSIISLYCGSSKPPIEDFLSYFISDMLILLRDGINFEDKTFIVSVRAICCDAPARAFVKCIKGHNAYYGCDRCIQRGSQVKHRTVFLDTDAEKITDDSFAQMNQPGHKTVTPLMQLNIGMITVFPQEPMHLIYLGIMRKLLFTWCGKGSTHLGKISSKQRQFLSEFLLEINKCWPSEFNRKPRSLIDLEHWKANEYHQFLLYIGPFILKNILPKVYYCHFMLLFVAIYILNSEELCRGEMNKYADDLLKLFVKESGKLYGKEFLVYNVHSLVHIADDAARLGPLHTFSSFPFENFLHVIKKKLKKSNQPLQQICRRIKEKEQWQSIKSSSKIHTKQFQPLHKNSSDSNRPNMGKSGISYKKITCSKFTLSINGRDSTVFLRNNSVMKIFNFIETEKELLVIGKVFTRKESFGHYPCDLKHISLYKVSNLSREYEVYSSNAIVAKAVLLPYRDDFACIPIIHTQLQ